MSNIPVITVDGPSGSGKGTLSVLLATTLKWHFLDSGAIYRLLGLYVQKKQVPLDREIEIARLAEALPAQFGDEEQVAGERRVWLAGEDVTTSLRTEETGFLASTIAKFPLVRSALLARQRAFRKPPGLVADGRDMGTVIFEDAPLKFFLEASAEERAKRRFLQLQEKGLDVSLEDLLTEINQRDLQDRKREISPLVPAEDAIVIDTTELSIETVYSRLIAEIQSRFPMWLNAMAE